MDWQSAFYKGHVALFLVLLIFLWQVKESLHFIETYRIPTTVESHTPPLRLPHHIDVASLHLFGEADIKGSDRNALPLTDLNFMIVGLFQGVGKAQSQVLLDTGTGEATRFSVGDELPEGVMLKKILADGVILERDGHSEFLPLDKDKLTFEDPNSEHLFNPE